MTEIQIVDRSTMIDRLHAALNLNPRRTAIVTIDMHRVISIRALPPWRQTRRKPGA